MKRTAAFLISALPLLASAGPTLSSTQAPIFSPGAAMAAALSNVTCPTTPWQTLEKNPSTGLLRCVRLVPACPEGWTGGMVQDALVCKPVPAPKLNCPPANPQNQANPYGTKFYDMGWQGNKQEIGCMVNNKPAY